MQYFKPEGTNRFVDNRRCLINRCPQLRGDRLFFCFQNGDVAFDDNEI
jgi:hypothetical protein